MADANKGNASMNDEEHYSFFNGHLSGGSDGLRHEEKDVAAAKAEELHPLKTPVGRNNTRTKMANNTDKISLDDLGANHADKNNVEKSLEKKRCEDFEDILGVVGSEGKFQKFLLYGVLCPIVTVSPFLLLNTVFLWDIPNHFCFVPGRNSSSYSLDEWKNLTLPMEMGPDGRMRFSQCKMYDQVTGNITKCQAGWEYDEPVTSTVPSEYDWVCDRDQYATDCFTWSSVGSAIGTIIFGAIGDKYGRKPVLFLACFCNIFFKTVSLFIPQYFFLYKVMQLFGGFAFPAVFTMPALICAEVSGPNYRSWIYAVTWMIWVLGNVMMPIIAWVCDGWFLFGCVTAFPTFLLFLYIPVVDESPRWQITAGKLKEAVKILHKMADKNGKKVEPGVIEQMVDELDQKQKEDAKKLGKVGMWTLFTKFNLAKNTIMLCIAFAMDNVLYYSVTLSSTKMAGNKFFNYFLLALMDLPGGWVAGKLVEITGRRWTQTGFFLMCVLSCIVCAVAVTFQNSMIVVIIASLGIKFGEAVLSLVVYLQATEIFPTPLRSSGSGLAATVGSIMGVFGPYIVYSGTSHVSLPYAMLCLCAVIGMLSAACLPETFKQNLPETIEDADNFGKTHKFWSYLPQSHDTKSDPEGAGAPRRARKISKK